MACVFSFPDFQNVTRMLVSERKPAAVCHAIQCVIPIPQATSAHASRLGDPIKSMSSRGPMGCPLSTAMPKSFAMASMRRIGIALPDQDDSLRQIA